MKWFKHDSTANMDAKLKRLKMQWGMEGYGLYWYCLEIIVQEVTSNKFTFELEHDSEIISHDTGISVEKVNRMMTSMVDLGLFENTGGRITCLKLAKRLDQSMTSNPAMRKLIAKTLDVDAEKPEIETPEPVIESSESSESHDPIMTESCKTRQDKTRLEKHLLTDVSVIAFDDWYQHYGRKKARGFAEKAWQKLKPEEKRLALERVQSPAFQSWLKSQVTSEGKDCRPYPATWLNARQWTDELDDSPQFNADRNVLEVKPCRP